MAGGWDREAKDLTEAEAERAFWDTPEDSSPERVDQAHLPVVRVPPPERRQRWVLEHQVLAWLIATLWLGGTLTVLLFRDRGDANPFLVVGLASGFGAILAGGMLLTVKRVGRRARRPPDEWWKG